MDYDWFKGVGAVAGVGGLALASVAYTFREIIRKEIFPQLTKAQAYKLLNRIITLIFIVGFMGLLAYVILNLRNGRTNSNKEAAPSPTPIPASKIDNSQNSPTFNAANNIRTHSQTPSNPNTNNKRSYRKSTEQPLVPSGIIQQRLDRPSEIGRNE